MTDRPSAESPDWLVALRAFGRDAMSLESVSIEAQTAQVICDYIDAVTRERNDANKWAQRNEDHATHLDGEVRRLTRERDEAIRDAADWKDKFFRSRSLLED